MIFLMIRKQKTLKSCKYCRERARNWRKANKERVSNYNKMYNDKKRDGETITVVLARKVGGTDWREFVSQHEVARQLHVHVANVNKVIKGTAK